MLLECSFEESLYSFGIDVTLQRYWKEKKLRTLENFSTSVPLFLSDWLQPSEIQLIISIVIHSHCDNLRAKKVLSDKDINAEFN